MNNTYWQDAQGRVYKWSTDAADFPIGVQGFTRINRDAYRKRIREQERVRFALDSHMAGESANEVRE